MVRRGAGAGHPLPVDPSLSPCPLPSPPLVLPCFRQLMYSHGLTALLRRYDYDASASVFQVPWRGRRGAPEYILPPHHRLTLPPRPQSFGAAFIDCGTLAPRTGLDAILEAAPRSPGPKGGAASRQNASRGGGLFPALVKSPAAAGTAAGGATAGDGGRFRSAPLASASATAAESTPASSDGSSTAPYVYRLQVRRGSGAANAASPRSPPPTSTAFR